MRVGTQDGGHAYTPDNAAGNMLLATAHTGNRVIETGKNHWRGIALVLAGSAAALGIAVDWAADNANYVKDAATPIADEGLDALSRQPFDVSIGWGDDELVSSDAPSRPGDPITGSTVAGETPATDSGQNGVVAPPNAPAAPAETPAAGFEWDPVTNVVTITGEGSQVPGAIATPNQVVNACAGLDPGALSPEAKAAIYAGPITTANSGNAAFADGLHPGDQVNCV